MAILTPGPMGRPNGKMKNIVYYTLRGQVISRMIGVQHKKPTRNQLANRQAMSVTMELLKPMQGFIKHGFEQSAKGTLCNPFNLATSYNKKNALQGEYPDISIDYTKVMLSTGALPLAKDLKITKKEDGLLLEWNPELLGTGDQYDDLVMVALYYPSIKAAILYLNAGKRDQGSCFIPISEERLLNSPIEPYLCFKSADGDRISDSVYLGNLNGSNKTREEKELNEKYNEVKARFEKVKESYLSQKPLSLLPKGLRSKSFNHLEKEYLTLKDKLEHMPGKPV